MKRAGELLSVFFDEKLLKKAKNYSDLFSSWARITEKSGIAAVAGYSRLKEFERGIILIEADHPGWVQILQTGEQRLLKNIRRLFPELDIRGISFMLSRNFSAREAEACPADVSGAAEPVFAGQEESDKSPERAPKTDVYERIDDQQFKDTLKRLEQSLRKRNSRQAR
ncbi:MAG: DUF721 domain-containing protein [Treponema sp.]|jgi:hypothetical protein|nr:DUF721 domain-containing protein [Treponema sp.]